MVMKEATLLFLLGGMSMIQAFTKPIARGACLMDHKGHTGEARHAPKYYMSDPAKSGGENAWSETVVEVKATKASIHELQQDLLLLLVGTNRGLNIKEAERKDIDAAIKLLEAENPHPRSTEGFESLTSPLAGNWRLIYTNAIDVLVLGLLPTVVIGRIYQNISPNGKIITNIAELQPGLSQLGFFPILGQIGDSVVRLKVEASSDVISPSRQSLTFRSAKLEPLKFLGFDVKEMLPRPKVNFGVNGSPVGYIETTFVDEDIRVGRSPGGSLFVFVRERGASPSFEDDI